ncbi:MAG: CNNM domain-containing protein [Opitutaceae bacterium]
MTWLIAVIVATLGVSFFCSLFEAVVLSTTVAEMEGLKRTRPRAGRLLETMRTEIDETMSAILSLNTLANGVGSLIVGALALRTFGLARMTAVTLVFAVLLFLLSEILPKNLAVTYRRVLQPVIVYPLWGLRRAFRPLTWLCNLLVRMVIGKPAPPTGSDEEIILLAERGAQEGTLTRSESNIIANTLSLDNIRVNAIMTPRTVIMGLLRGATVASVLNEHANLPFGRIPVFGRNVDDVVGVVRRRDLLAAKAGGRDSVRIEQLMHEAHFVPETATVANALQIFLRAHRKLLIATDEFGATAGIVTMEDVIEHLLGREIFENDDFAVDMREFARMRQAQALKAGRQRRGETATGRPGTKS